MLSTRMLVSGLREVPAAERPSVLVSQSATGYYGPHGDEPLEEDAPAGTTSWPESWWSGSARRRDRRRHARRLHAHRRGVSPTGGALSTMLPFFRLGLGGPVAGRAPVRPLDPS